MSFYEANADVHEYQKKADDLHLADERYWHLLLHFTGKESEIDDPKFFFTKNGKTDPQRELHATIDAFYNETTLDDNSSACRFPARLEWLKEKLELKDLPIVTCKKYDEIVKKLDPKSVTLVFPAAHINSPASMFGHTFLRINSSYNSKLLSYAINYSARSKRLPGSFFSPSPACKKSTISKPAASAFAFVRASIPA